MSCITRPSNTFWLNFNESQVLVNKWELLLVNGNNFYNNIVGIISADMTVNLAIVHESVD